MSDEWITEATNAKPRSGVALPSNSTSLASGRSPGVVGHMVHSVETSSGAGLRE